MSGIIGFILGVVVAVVFFIWISSKKNLTESYEKSNLEDDIELLTKHNDELKEEIERLLEKNKTLYKNKENLSDDNDDLIDEVEDKKKELKKAKKVEMDLRNKIDELESELEEYKLEVAKLRGNE